MIKLPLNTIKREVARNFRIKPFNIFNSFTKSSRRFFTTEETSKDREELETDVVIVGGGPSGLATAIKLKQLAKANNKEIDVTIVEKGAEIGSHILSGNVFESSVMAELIPDWVEKGAPISTKVTKDKFLILTQNSSISIPQILLPKDTHNIGNHIVSLSEVCRWLGKEAEELGVNVFTGFSANDIIFNKETNRIEGIMTNDFGIGKNGEKKENFQAGVNIKAKYTVLAEGARGSISEKVLDKFNLRTCPSKYGIGLKEVWEVPENHPHFSPGLVQHSVLWPLTQKEYGGSFLYHMSPNLIHIGFVVGLDYKNPYINPYEEFQKFKTHKEIRKFLEGGRCISYGARTMNSSGFYSIPKMAFPGGLFVGCSAGLLNVSKIKGAHNAIRSGIIAAQTINEVIINNKKDIGKLYESNFRKSPIYAELYRSRNFKGGYKSGLFSGMIHSFLINLSKGKEFWSLKPTKKDSECTQKKSDHKPIEYPKHDGKLTFDLLENLARSGTNHEGDQPSHLKIKPNLKLSNLKSLNEYGAPEEKFCPAKVYEFIKNEKGEPVLQINAQNCLHCKCCSIKMVDEYIDWTVPEGSGGPKYNLM